MKRKTIIAIILILAFLAIPISNLSAGTWYKATVNGTGIHSSSDVVWVNLSSDSWQGRLWFVISGTNKKAVLAVALTAISMDRAVTVELSSTDQWSVITGMTLALPEVT